MVSTTLPSDPHRSRKFNGDKREEHLQKDVSAEDKSHLQLHNGCTEIKSSTERLLQEAVEATCASQEFGEPIQDPKNSMVVKISSCKDPEDSTLPAAASTLDENSNVLSDESDGRRKSVSEEDSGRPVSSCPINNTTKPPGCEGQRDNISTSNDLPLGSCQEEDHADIIEQSIGGKTSTGENIDSDVLKDGEKDVATKAAKKDAQQMMKTKEKGSVEQKSSKKLGEHDGEIKKTGVHDEREKVDKEKTADKQGKLQGKINSCEHTKKGKTKKESGNHVDKQSTQEKPVLISVPIKKEPDTKEKPTTSSKHKDHSKSKDRSPGIEKDKHKSHSDKGKTKDKDHIKEENVHMLVKEQGNTAKRTLVDLDLFQTAPADDRKQRTRDNAKGKSHEKDKQKRGDDKGKKRDKDARKPKEEKKKDDKEVKSAKRELEDQEEESESGHKKSKHDPESRDKSLKIKQEAKDHAGQDKASTSRKRKSKDDEQTKAKKAKEAKEKEEESKWKWWEEDNYENGVKWKFLEHRGPYFAPPYETLPENVRFLYDGQPMKLSLAAEEVATFYGKMLDHEYTSKEAFQKNFFTDWKTQMTKEEKKIIKHLYMCDFSEIHKYFTEKNEARKALPKEEKQKLKKEADKIQEEYGYCMLDGHREKIGNFKTEPPGLFRGRGDHPKMGMLKLRIKPEDVIINCSQDSKIPEPPAGHKWKEVRFDNTVTWLVSWTENIQSSIKYIMLNPSSKLKGEKDWQKYETARRLKAVVDQIRSQYRIDWKSREMKKRQRAVALYFIDKLALRAGNEKEEGETADTVGCCSLRVEHIKLFPELDGQHYVVEFDFLGKDSIRYYNKVPVEKEVFKNLKRFMENKDPEDDLFDRLNTTIVNKHLQDLMDGLTAKVFRTYNASITLQMQLKELTNEEDNVAAKILSYNRANRAVALLCNHQRALPKTFEKSMQNLQAKIDAKEQQLKEAKKELKKAKADHKAKQNDRTKKELEKKKKQCERLEEQLMKLKLQATDKEENKQVALGTSKLNYLDPRITVAWCKKYGVPIEKIYNKTQREKFAWAIDMTNQDFEF
ncbi:DNA topoisomerase I, mitochondrial isoform X2 [Mixophyes fleayi]